MAQRVGKCTNYSGCKLAYRNEKITVVTKDFRCPECGSALEPIGPPKRSSYTLIISICVAAVLLLAIGAILWTLSAPQKRHPVVVELTGTPTPMATTVETPEPTATPTPIPTPTPSPTQAPTPEVASTPENLDLTGADLEEVKKGILKRIELQPTASRAQKDKAYAIVQNAKGMGRIVIISFATAITTLPAQDIASIQSQLAQPRVQKLLEEPTLVLVILGYADKQGNDQRNIDLSFGRAQTVADILRNKCGILNLMYPIPMGGTDLFDQHEFSKNRVVEVWAIKPQT
jgi:outer membrane protein OmpA-like peptidoglycan-associated protein